MVPGLLSLIFLIFVGHNPGELGPPVFFVVYRYF